MSSLGNKGCCPDVLVVDDNHVNRMIGVRLIEIKYSLKAIDVTDGDEAIDILTQYGEKTCC